MIEGSVFMKYRIRRVFKENVTALIKMRCFLEGILSPLAVKKGEAEARASTHQDVMFYRIRFAALTEKKGDAGAAALYWGKSKRRVRLAFTAN